MKILALTSVTNKNHRKHHSKALSFGMMSPPGGTLKEADQIAENLWKAISEISKAIVKKIKSLKK